MVMNGLYQVSNLGRIKSLARKRKGTTNTKDIIMKSCNKNGYNVVNLWKSNKKKTLKVHRLVAEAFIPNPHKKPYVNHLNAIRNDNNMNNLEWCTQKENILYAYRISSRQTRRIEQYDLKNNFIRSWSSIKDASNKLKISDGHICSCCKGKRKSAGGFIWKYIA